LFFGLLNIFLGSEVQLVIVDGDNPEPIHADPYCFDYGDFLIVYGLCINALINGEEIF